MIYNVFNKSFYSILELRHAIPFPMAITWNSWVLSKVCFFACEASWGKVLTMDHIQKRVGVGE